MSSNPIPVAMAVLLCQTTILDRQTNNRSLINIFQNITAPLAPVAFSGGLYVKLIDGTGNYSISIKLVQMKGDKTLTSFPPLQLKWENPGPLDIGLNFQGLVLPDFGDYEFQVYADQIYLGRTVFTVSQLSLPNPPASS